MKTKLYHKFIKLVCSSFKITQEQLFSRDFDAIIASIAKDDSHLMVLSNHHPLAQIWECYAFHTRWLVKHWKYSHWKPYIQMKLDLGFKLDDVLDEIASNVR